MDSTDKKIVKLLVKNGRIPINKISSSSKISVPNVRNRIKELTRTSTLKVMGEVDANKVSEIILAIVAIKLKTESFNKKFNEIASLPEVNWAYTIIEVAFYKDKADLYYFFASLLHNVYSIEMHETFVVFKSHNRWIYIFRKYWIIKFVIRLYCVLW